MPLHRAVRPDPASMRAMNDRLDRRQPVDQADGLRRLFAKAPVRLVPVVANPHVRLAGALLEQLSAALVGAGSRVLLVDTADTATASCRRPAPDLAGRIEPLTPRLGYLAAHGLPARWLDEHGSTAGFLQAVTEAAGDVDILLVHGGAADLGRMLARQTVCSGVRPVLLADDRPASVTHAYASMKLLVQRTGLMEHHLMLGAADDSPRAGRIAARLASCADLFLGAMLRSSAQVDPAAPPLSHVAPALERLARALAGCRTAARADAAAAAPTPPVSRLH